MFFCLLESSPDLVIFHTVGLGVDSDDLPCLQAVLLGQLRVQHFEIGYLAYLCYLAQFLAELLANWVGRQQKLNFDSELATKDKVQDKARTVGW